MIRNFIRKHILRKKVVNQIFIGGFGGTGSRVVAEIFEGFGYYIGREYSNKTLDFGGHNFRGTFNRCWRRKEFTPLFTYINDTIESNINHFAIKHGHLMFINKELKEMYPKCKTVYVMRHPIDSAAGPSKEYYKPHVEYGELRDNLDNKIKFYIEQSIKSCKEADLVIRYEDLCNDTENELKKIRDFTGKYDVNLPDVEINESDNTGIHTDLYGKYDTSMLGY